MINMQLNSLMRYCVSHQDVSTFQFSVNCPCAACVC